MIFQINSNQLILENGAHVDFDLSIKCAIKVLGIVVVALDVPPKQSMNENVFGVSSEGKILWQIERIPNASNPICRYTDVNVIESGPDNLLCRLEQYPEYKGLGEYARIPGTFIAGNWCGSEAIVDVKTGKVLRTFCLR
jgi:hypothetical protein